MVYVCVKQIGAPPEVVARLEEACSASAATMGRSGGMIGQDPALDQFMEAYCEMLTKYEQELSKPFKEAMLFLSRIESQFKALSIASSDSGSSYIASISPHTHTHFSPQYLCRYVCVTSEVSTTMGWVLLMVIPI